MTKESKLQRIRCSDAEVLLQSYDYWCRHFNPVDSDSIEWFTLIKDEIIRRMTE